DPTMMLISTKVCVALLWGLCVFSAVESESVDTPENKNSTENSTAPWNTSNVPNNEEETTAATRAPSQKPTEVSAATEAASRMSATEETDEKQAATSTSSGNAAGLTAMSTAAAATAAANTPSVRPILSSTAATTADRAAPSSQSATAAPRDVTKTTPGTEVQACSTRAVMKHCLIVIASLAALATIFIMSTIVLCVKLSAKKYRVKRSQEGTEMMCISALLPDRSYNYTRQRNPVPNGVLVIPRAGDSDEEGGDTVTLSSFLPENDRYV
uniref:P-selectin glycoprotein ligand 1 n=1 Tax=Salarias fasciatus TaxID=181472 RepID=A0A672FR81_SALFA